MLLLLMQNESEAIRFAQAIKGIGWPEALVLAALILGICYIIGKMLGN